MRCFRKPIADSLRSYLSSTRVEESLILNCVPQNVDKRYCTILAKSIRYELYSSFLIKLAVLLPGWFRQSRIEKSMNQFEIKLVPKTIQTFHVELWKLNSWILSLIFWSTKPLVLWKWSRTPNGFPSIECFSWNSCYPHHCCIVVPLRLKVFERNFASNWLSQLIPAAWFTSFMASGSLTSCCQPVRLHGFCEVGRSIPWSFHSARSIRSTFGTEFNNFTEVLGIFQSWAASSLWI